MGFDPVDEDGGGGGEGDGGGNGRGGGGCCAWGAGWAGEEGLGVGSVGVKLFSG